MGNNPVSQWRMTGTDAQGVKKLTILSETLPDDCHLYASVQVTHSN
jgi:hypothetical protein